ncbi:MAG: hypothetical protein KJ595_16355 [Gammaproteobacteria bacterium]|nr:hypothetical protein [Gammaproteobacteria bacterium]
MSVIKSISILLVVAIFPGALEAQDLQAGKQAASNYYDKGKQAYEDGDLIGAVKYLFAYKISHSDALSEDPDFLATVDAVLEQSERALRKALDNQKQWERWVALTRSNPSEIASSTLPERTASMPLFQDHAVRYQLLQKQIELKHLELEKLHLEAELYEGSKLVE